MENCVYCLDIDYGDSIDLRKDVCKSCRKKIKRNFPIEYTNEFQYLYRTENSTKMKEYRVKYKSIFKKKLGLFDEEKPKQTRFYICKIGFDKIKIGITFEGSHRMYHLKRKANILGLEFEKLYFIDCENEAVIRKIESVVKKSFCNLLENKIENFFEKEITSISNLDVIILMAKKMLETNNIKYTIL